MQKPLVLPQPFSLFRSVRTNQGLLPLFRGIVSILLDDPGSVQKAGYLRNATSACEPWTQPKFGRTQNGQCPVAEFVSARSIRPQAPIQTLPDSFLRFSCSCVYLDASHGKPQPSSSNYAHGSLPTKTILTQNCSPSTKY
jgi:hypothetical protein